MNKGRKRERWKITRQNWGESNGVGKLKGPLLILWLFDITSGGGSIQHCCRREVSGSFFGPGGRDMALGGEERLCTRSTSYMLEQVTEG